MATKTLVGRLQANGRVSSRHLVLPPEQYATLTGLRESNATWSSCTSFIGRSKAAAQTGSVRSVLKSWRATTCPSASRSTIVCGRQSTSSVRLLGHIVHDGPLWQGSVGDSVL
jgi:hypothetical protein